MSASDTWQHVRPELFALLRDRRFDDALALLARAREDALRANDGGAAALFSTWRGSLLSSQERHDDALVEYEIAEADDPSNPTWKIGTAHHLLELDQPQRALEKIDEAMRGDVPGGPHLAYAIQGLAFVAQGRVEDALDVLRRMLEGIREDDLADMLDLRLVEALVAESAADDAVREYIDRVRAKAEAEHHEQILRRIATLDERLTR